MSGQIQTRVTLDVDTHSWLVAKATGYRGSRDLFRFVERYVERGFACHWLHGKAPYQQNWSSLPVATVQELKQTYQLGNNLGVRVGKWSVLEPGFGLVVLDIDLERLSSVGCML
jgi:hypothetical protein